jgi:hypothetical protein
MCWSRLRRLPRYPAGGRMVVIMITGVVVVLIDRCCQCLRLQCVVE